MPAFSQNGNPLQFLRDVSQSSSVNPAFQNKTEKLVIGLPIVSGANFNWGANFAIEYFRSERFTVDFQKFYDSLDEPGNAFSSAQIPLIYLSMRDKKRAYSFSVTEKMVGTTNFDNEFINFAAQGLIPYYNNDANFNPLSFKAHYYREIAFGYSTVLREKFTIGFRPKVLFGKFYYGTDKLSIDVTTDERTEHLVVTPSGGYTVAGPVNVIIDEEKGIADIQPDVKPNDYFFNFRNMGAGIDIGATFAINKQTEVALSILDIGFTSLKHKTYTSEFTDALHYHKSRLYQSSDSLAPNYWSPEYAMRTMADSIPFISTISEPGRKLNALPLQINAHLKHSLSNKLQIGASNHYTYYKNHSNNYFTGFLNASLGQKFEASTTLSLYNTDKVLLGLGGSYTGNSFQFYLSSNNILDLIKPTSAKNLNLWFGVNFLFSTS